MLGLDLRVTASFAVAASTSFGILAQSNPSAQGIDEVLVLERRQAYRGAFAPLEIPGAALEIDQALIDQAGVRDLSAALDLSASVSRQNNFGGLWNAFAVRGFVGDENLPSGYLVNGFNAGRGFAGPRDISGVERVEVLKGPKSALFGRGEPGGAINLVTKRPTFEEATSMRLSAASFDTFRADFDWTAPVGESVAVRVVAFNEDAGSFRDTVETRRYGASPSVAVRIGESTLLTYEMEAARQKIPFDRGIVAVNGTLGVLPVERFLGEPGDGPMETEVLGHQLELQHEFNDNWSLLAGVGYRDTSLEGFSSDPELAANRQRLSTDGRTLTRQRRSRAYDAVYEVLRAEIAGRFETGRVQHRFLVGADVDSFDNDQIFGRFRGPTLATNPTLQQSYAIDILQPVYGQFPLPTPTPLTDRLDTQEATGLYVQDQITLGERVQLRFGGRYDDASQDLNNRLTRVSTSQSDSRFSPQLGFVYAATSSVSVYATYGEGFRLLSGSDFAGNAFEPNTTKSSEAGMVFELRDGALSGTLSAFSIEQANILVADPANAGFSLPGGQARSRGLEFDLSAELARGVNLWLSVTSLDAQMQNDVLDFNFGLPIRAGDPLLNVPEQTVSLQVAKEWNANGRPLTVGGGLLHVGERLGEAATQFMLPDYTIVRAFVGLDLSQRVGLRAEIDNLTDETYYTNSFAQLWIQPGMPRSIRVSAELAF